MKMTKKASSLIIFILCAIPFNAYNMEPLEPKEKKPSKLRRFQSWVEDTGQAMLENIPIRELPFVQKSKTGVATMGLPKELVDQIVLFLSISTTAPSLKIAADAIRSLSLVNHDLNDLINSPDFCLLLIKNLANKFKCSHLAAAEALNTPQARHQIKLQRRLFAVLDRTKPSESTFIKLLKEGADLEFTFGLGTPLIYASLMNERDNINFLLNQGANINGTNHVGQTALMIAAGASKTDIVALLATTPHININQQDMNGDTALLIAITQHLYTPEAITKVLLNAGADPERANAAGLTPLKAAQKKGNQKIIELIQNAIDKKHGKQ